MARTESQREDLMAEATALTERVEFGSDGAEHADTPMVAGFRADGAFSLFFGEDPVYHFNASGELRRAYVDGHLLKASAGRLALLRRERTAEETRLVRHDLSPEEQQEFLEQMSERLRWMAAGLADGGIQVLRQFPSEADVRGRVNSWLRTHPEPDIAARPNVAG